jgi:hypothetical protein
MHKDGYSCLPKYSMPLPVNLHLNLLSTYKASLVPDPLRRKCFQFSVSLKPNASALSRLNTAVRELDALR